MEGVNRAAWMALGVCLLASGCQWEQSRKPSVLVIAVEGLGFSLTPCQENEVDAAPSGFHTMCEESVRFTHAFTPSVMSQAALASLLTARYPHEHGVRSNGPDFLSNTIETVAEAAHHKKYVTSFISGGPPIWSKSGFGQGMDLFDDRVKIDLHRSYRPVQESFRTFLNWLDADVKSRSFLSFIYVPDLQFPRALTVNDMGEPRELSLQSQIREVDESLHYLFSQLRQRNQWERTTIVLVGLNGNSSERHKEETKSLSLHSENTQVTLFIKPSGKKRDLAMNWKVDSNVSLVDVGATLFELVGVNTPEVRGRQLVVHSLKDVLAGGDFPASDDRVLLSESAWTKWHFNTGIRLALRRGEFFLFWEAKPRVFNTLTDRFELTSLQETDSRALEFRLEASQILREKQLTPWAPLDETLVEKQNIAFEMWSTEQISPHVLKDLRSLSARRPHDEQLMGWLATALLRLKMWPELAKLGKRADKAIWEYVALRNMGKMVWPPESSCFQYVLVKPPLFQKVFPKKCEDDLFGLFLSWINAADERARELYRERFFRHYRSALIDQEIAAQNAANGFLWDVPAREPAGPSLTELAIALPENTKYEDIIRRRMTSAEAL